MYIAAMPQLSTVARLADIAEDQWGLVTRQQAQNAGISRASLDRLTAERSVLERVDHGVYRLTVAPVPDHLALRAAWLRLAPEVPRWKRTPEQGVVSHRSAASLYGVGHLPADRQEFTVPTRRQSRRPDVRLHVRRLGPGKWIELGGLPVTRPSRIASDLLLDKEDPEAVAQIIADSIRHVFDYPGTFAESLAPHAASFGLRKGDGLALLRWLLDLVGNADTDRWMEEARQSVARRSDSPEAGGWSQPPAPTLGSQ
jgi:Transcriptional regulator, AbiEi antitoxin